MNQIHQLIQELRKRSDVGVADQQQSWLVIISKGPDYVCEVTVPHKVLEWFACVKDQREKKEVWSDWMDYSGYDDRPTEKLEGEMADDILAFVNRVLTSELKLPLKIRK
jgi:hypothetical protein